MAPTVRNPMINHLEMTPARSTTPPMHVLKANPSVAVRDQSVLPRSPSTPCATRNPQPTIAHRTNAPHATAIAYPLMAPLRYGRSFRRLSAGTCKHGSSRSGPDGQAVQKKLRPHALANRFRNHHQFLHDASSARGLAQLRRHDGCGAWRRREPETRTRVIAGPRKVSITFPGGLLG